MWMETSAGEFVNLDHVERIVLRLEVSTGQDNGEEPARYFVEATLAGSGEKVSLAGFMLKDYPAESEANEHAGDLLRMVRAALSARPNSNLVLSFRSGYAEDAFFLKDVET